MNAVLEEVGKIGLVPVVKINDAKKALPLAKALIAGGLPCAEITFRTDAAAEAIRAVTQGAPEALVGAGTVLSTEQAERAVGAGAKFIVSPGLNPKVVSWCIGKGVPVIPGCATPSDMERAMELGLDAVKFFPAEQAGGLDYLKAIAAPYSRLKFMPTGGVNQNNLARYIAWERILACGGSWMVSEALIEKGDFDAITALCKDAVRVVLGFSLAHVGINAADSTGAESIAGIFARNFGFPLLPGKSSCFAGSAVEVMSGGGRGTHGHIAINTNSVSRAMAALERQGVAFDLSTLKTDASGRPTLVYLKDEAGGFAVHLRAA